MKRIAPATDPRTIAALHRAGRVWRAVVAKRKNGQLQLIDSREFRHGEFGHIETWLDQHQAGRTICVLPASNVICRTCMLPDAPPSQLERALQLQAETYLEGTAPSHRQAMAVLHQAPGETTRAGLILAWPEKGPPPEVPVDRDVTWAPDVACLAALLNGTRIDEPLLWVDRVGGSVALALCHSGGAVFRAAREQSADPLAWRTEISRLLAETAYNVGHTDEFTESLVCDTSGLLEHVGPEGASLLASPGALESARARLENSKVDPAWWSRFGIAAGALLATLDQLEPVTQIRQSQPVETPGRWDRLLARLATRRAAATWLVAALVMLAFGPLVFAGGRLLILKAKVGDLNAFQTAQEEREEQLVVYEELAQNTWPMAKLLADLVNAAPEGIVIDSIVLKEGSDEFEVRGEVDREEPYLEFAHNLEAKKIFSNVTKDYNDRDQQAAKAKITVGGRVALPYHFARYDDDFATNPLGRRLYGERFAWHRTEAEPEEMQVEAVSHEEGEGEAEADGSSTGLALGPSHEEGDGNAASRTRDPLIPGRTSARPNKPPAIPRAAEGEDAQPRGPQIPEPMSEADIRKLDKKELLSALGRVSTARRQPGVTEEQRRVLDEQFDMMRDALRNNSP